MRFNNQHIFLLTKLRRLASIVVYTMLLLFSVITFNQTLSFLTNVECAEITMAMEENNTSNEKDEIKHKELDDFDKDQLHNSGSIHTYALDYNSADIPTISFHKEIPSPPPDLV